MSIRADIQHYFESHPDRNVFLKDLEKEFPDLNSRQIQNGVYQLMQKADDTGVSVIQNGQIWRYTDKNSVSLEGEEIISVLQVTPKESIIFQREDKSIWIARKVED